MSTSSSAAAAQAGTQRPFNAAEVTQWLNARFHAIEADAANPDIPHEARPEVLRVAKPSGGNGVAQSGAAGAWGGSKKQTNTFVADVIKAAQAGASSAGSGPGAEKKQ